MSGTTGLKILQYNVQKKKDAVMAPLLEDESARDIDVFAIQEPSRNSMNGTSFNPSSSRFYLAHSGEPEARTCFYISKRLDPEKWKVSYRGFDLCSLRLLLQGPRIAGTPEGEDIVVWIHNVYNPSPVSLTSQDSPSTIPLLGEALQEEGEHIAVGDFNLHHPQWNNPGRYSYHAMADTLLELTEAYEMEIGLPEGSVTWQGRGSQSAIDLSFLSPGVHNALLRCGIQKELDFGSDHLPILTELEWDCQPANPRRRRAWRRAELQETREDIEAQADILNAVMRRHQLETKEDIEAYADKLVVTLQEIADNTIPDTAPFAGSKSYWNAACERTTKAAKKALREYRYNRDDETEERLRVAEREKVTTLRRTRTLQYREGVHAASLKKAGVWRLAKWGRKRSMLPKEIPQFPPIKDGNGGEARDFEGKVRALRRVLFPPPPQADLSDIVGAEYPPPITMPIELSDTEVWKAIHHPAADKAPGISGLPNRFLRVVCAKLLGSIRRLFQACLALGHHPRRFKEANTVVLKKPKKADYSEPKAYRPIALLDTLGKALETVISKRLSDIAEKSRLLPDQQMGARKGRSVETALETITDSIHTVWNQGTDNVASLLSLDVAGAFDNVSHERLLYNLRKKGIPTQIVAWTSSFLEDRATTVTIGSRTSDIEEVTTGIPQGSPISPILFLFFNAPLIEECAKVKAPIQVGGFVDDIHLLTYGKSTEGNCRRLEQVHQICLKWAKTHGASFAPQKYELVHLTRTPRKFNMTEAVRFNNTEVGPSASIRVLGLHIDTKLRWGPHITQVKAKAATQIRAIKCLTGSTWGATFSRCRTVYTAVVRPMLTFAAPIWHHPKGTSNATNTLVKVLNPLQNDGIRTSLGAFRATPIPVLEVEAAVPSIQDHLDHLVLKDKALRGTHPVTVKGNRVIRRRLRGKRGRVRAYVPTPTEEKEQWALQEIGCQGWDEAATATQRKAHWHNPAVDIEEFQDIKNIANRVASRALQRREDRWQAYKSSQPLHAWSPATQGPLDGDRLDFHTGLRKAESSVATQIRSGKIGFNAFLHRARVPGVLNSRCHCGWARQDAKHIILFCPEYASQRRQLIQETQTNDFRILMTEAKGIRATARWMIRTGCLDQFRLAKTQLSRSKLPLEAAVQPKVLKVKKAKRKDKGPAGKPPECCRPYTATEAILVE